LSSRSVRAPRRLPPCGRPKAGSVRSSEPVAPRQAGVAMAPLTTLGVGGAARWFTRAENLRDVAAGHAWCVEHDAPMFVLGGGSNLVVADEGVDGLVLQVALAGTTFAKDGADTVVHAPAGESW